MIWDNYTDDCYMVNRKVDCDDVVGIPCRATPRELSPKEKRRRKRKRSLQNKSRNKKK